MLRNIPAELRVLRQWVVAGYDKKPINPKTGQLADVTDPSTWGTFEEALQAGLNGVGFVLTANDPYTIIDLDDKADRPATTEQKARHEKIINAMNSYTERSTSGRGFHVIVKGQIPQGVKRDTVEMYSNERYMICTGNVINPLPIAERQELLSLMYSEMVPKAETLHIQGSMTMSDRSLIEVAQSAKNGEKFDALCNGDMSDYPSQSEADSALLSILCFYSQCDEQVKRVFRYSKLGKREKATANDKYLDRSINALRQRQVSQLKPLDIMPNVMNLVATSNTNETAPTPITTPNTEYSNKLDDVVLPPGLVGEVASYMYATATRPIGKIALASSIALLAGICGRSYNVSNTGLNQYIILLAETGRGKDGVTSGMELLLASIRPMVPMVDQFIGPARFASGQALIRVLNEKPSFVSVLGEFGLTLQGLSSKHANSAQLMLKQVLLDLYSKSGWGRILHSSVYSDSDKNTKIIQAPNVTILGESTPEAFYDGLDASHVAEGLIPRFSIIEYNGLRPKRNRNAGIAPTPELARAVADLTAISLTNANNNTCAPVQTTPEGLAVLDQFDEKADAVMNSSKLNVENQLWNRAHLKAWKLAALIAVGCNPHMPVIDASMAQWAVDFVESDISVLVTRFSSGDVGQGDAKQFNDLKRAIEAYYKSPSKTVKDKFGNLHKAKIIPYAYLLNRTASVASYRNDRLGATPALKRAIQAMCDSGMLVEIAKTDMINSYNFSGIGYTVGGHWS